MFTSNQEMGLGLMVVSKSGETFYANLWLPGRYCNHQSPTQEQNELPNGSCRSYHNVPAGIVITSISPTRTKQTAVLKWKQLHSELWQSSVKALILYMSMQSKGSVCCTPMPHAWPWSSPSLRSKGSLRWLHHSFFCQNRHKRIMW